MKEIPMINIPITEFKKDVFASDDDTDILSFIETLRRNGVSVPEFNLTTNQMFALVFYENGFNLYLISYLADKNDSGYVFNYYKNFLSENVLNIKAFEELGFDSIEMVSIIEAQVKKIAKDINYLFTISTRYTRDFVGLVATANDPVAEITNSDGHNN
jgi:hypothetical protein